jgi:hypothetical protein
VVWYPSSSYVALRSVSDRSVFPCPGLSLPASLPNPSLGFRFICHARDLLRLYVWAILLGLGMTYAISSGLAEYYYAQASRVTDAAQMITMDRKAAVVFPLDRRYRMASAIAMGNIAIQGQNKDWMKITIPEIKAALVTDPTQADLLFMLIVCDLTLGQNDEAQTYFNQFKYYAKNSPLIEKLQGK